MSYNIQVPTPPSTANRITPELLEQLKLKTDAAKFLIIKQNLASNPTESVFIHLKENPHSLVYFTIPKRRMEKMLDWLNQGTDSRTEQIELSLIEFKTLIDHGHYLGSANVPLDMSVGVIFAQLLVYLIQVAEAIGSLALFPVLLLLTTIILYPLLQRMAFAVRGLPMPTLSKNEVILGAKEWFALLFGLMGTDVAKKFIPAEVGELAGIGGASSFIIGGTLWSIFMENAQVNASTLTGMLKKALPLSAVFSLLLFCDGLIQKTELNTWQKQMSTDALFIAGLPLGKMIMNEQLAQRLLPYLYEGLTKFILLFKNKFRAGNSSERATLLP